MAIFVTNIASAVADIEVGTTLLMNKLHELSISTNTRLTREEKTNFLKAANLCRDFLDDYESLFGKN